MLILIFRAAVFGGIGLCYGQGAVVMWPDWSAWTWWGVGTAMIPLLWFPNLYQHRAAIIGWLRRDGLVAIGRNAAGEMVTIPTSLAAIAFLALVAGLSGLGYGSYYLFTIERPSYEWVHPTLSTQDQEKAKAECRMAAYEAIGPSRAVMDTASHDRGSYVASCLTIKGFNRERVDG